MPNRTPDPQGDRGERAVLDAIATRLEAAGGVAPAGETWIGDDAAVLARRESRIVAASDACVENVHADLSITDPADVGWKAMVATLSDVASMGAVPWVALSTLVVPDHLEALVVNDGVADASEAFSCPVVGGDVSSGACLVVAISALGLLAGTAPPMLRSGARPGDALVVTGPLGASSAGLRALRTTASSPSAHLLIRAHRRPTPRLVEGEVARRAGVRGAIDLSDGLSIDLDRLALASGVGIELEIVPIAKGASEHDALSGGEDYEIVMATNDEGRLRDAFGARGLRAPIRIGRVVEDPSVRTLRGERLEPSGYTHRLR